MARCTVRVAMATAMMAALGCHEPPVASAPATVELAEPAPRRPEAPVLLEGCAASVAELPASAIYDPDDPRLREPMLLVAHKSARRLMLVQHGRTRDCVAMGLGFAPQGHKRQEGDGRTPEGWYRTSDKPWSDFPGAIAIHYPNESDAGIARSDGRLSETEHQVVMESLAEDRVPPQQTPMGGEVLIHGGGSGQDWTLGCMALEDEDLERIREALPQDKRVSLLVLP